MRPTRPQDDTRTFIEALKEKYAPETSSKSDKASIRISGKEVEEVGFEKISQQLRGLSKLKVILLDGLSIALTSAQEETKHNLYHVAAICPSVVDLDLSRNLLETLDEVAQTCQDLNDLRSLRLDGNRFHQTDVKTRKSLRFIDTLSLEDTLLTWEDILELCDCCLNLKSLNLNENQFTHFSDIVNVNSISHVTTLELSSNLFTAVSDFAVISALPHLQTLAVNHGTIRRISNGNKKLRFGSTLRRLEFAFNEIDDWDFINNLDDVFPGIQSLRISHNPLYQSLQTIEGRPISHEIGYLLTIARVAHLKMLNYSSITDRDRTEADTYYLAQIGNELQNNLVDEKTVLLKHPRYRVLCDAYGKPEFHSSNGAKDPGSLGANLLLIHVFCEFDGMSRKSFDMEIPKRLSLYSTFGLIGKQIGLAGSMIELYWQTEQWDGSNAIAHDKASQPWDSDDDDNNEMNTGCEREIKLCPGTKSIGNTVDQNDITIRVVKVHNASQTWNT